VFDRAKQRFHQIRVGNLRHHIGQLVADARLDRQQIQSLSGRASPRARLPNNQI